MPELKVVSEQEFGIEFEAYCSKCGAGICSEVEVVNTRRRAMPSIRINPCPNCMNELKDQIEHLENLIDLKNDQIRELNKNTNARTD